MAFCNVYYVKLDQRNPVCRNSPLYSYLTRRWAGIFKSFPVAKALTPSCHPPAAATPGSAFRHAQRSLISRRDSRV
nr:MAG TPA: hypothetical protein [Caudoviricetes sp.]